jgi:hypothetical protein
MPKDELVISDGGSRVLISSIAAYTACRISVAHDSTADVAIEVTLKSGEVITMSFGHRTLRDKAIFWLDEHFGTKDMEYEPCPYCEHSIDGIKNPEDRERCNWCGSSNAFRYFKDKGELDE